MKRYTLAAIALVLMPCVASAAGPSIVPATQPAVVESKPVVKDGASVVVSLKQQTISTEQQPTFTVRFSNAATDYINLYNVDAFWDWRIEFTSTDKHADQPGPWVLKMASIPLRGPSSHRQIKAGESTEMLADLNDPPFTFAYAYEGPMDKLVAPIRHLAPGTYRVRMTIALKNPFGPGHHEWEGPVTTEPVELNVRPLRADEMVPPTAQQDAAYGAAIHRVTDKLQPGGLWLNGGSPEVNLASDAAADDVIDAAVNGSSLDSKAYRVFKVEPFSSDGMPAKVSGSAALVRVGKGYKVVVLFPLGKSGWWTRFYDTDIAGPATQPVVPMR